jgi:hypothetical protein
MKSKGIHGVKITSVGGVRGSRSLRTSFRSVLSVRAVYQRLAKIKTYAYLERLKSAFAERWEDYWE